MFLFLRLRIDNFEYAVSKDNKLPGSLLSLRRSADN